MTDESLSPALRGSVWSAVGSLMLSSSTLVCCALPALMVAIGAGAALAGLVTAVPQLVWLSEHKPATFGTAGVALVAAGIVQWRTRSLPCPTDPVLARACTRTRRMASWTYVFAVVTYAVGATFAFVLPHLI